MAFVYEEERWKTKLQDYSSVPVSYLKEDQSYLAEPDLVEQKKGKMIKQNKVPFNHSEPRFKPIMKKEKTYIISRSRKFDEFEEALNDLADIRNESKMLRKSQEQTQGSDQGSVNYFDKVPGRDEMVGGPFEVNKKDTPGPGYYFPSSPETLKKIISEQKSYMSSTMVEDYKNDKWQRIKNKSDTHREKMSFMKDKSLFALSSKRQKSERPFKKHRSTHHLQPKVENKERIQESKQGKLRERWLKKVVFPKFN